MLITIDFLITELAKIHTPENGWLFFDHVDLKSECDDSVQFHMDAWAITLYGATTKDKNLHSPYLRRGFIVRPTAKELFTDLNNTAKYMTLRALTHELYYVLPAEHAIKPKQMKDTSDGLIEWDGDSLWISRQAKHRKGLPPRWNFFISLCTKLLENTRHGQIT